MMTNRAVLYARVAVHGERTSNREICSQLKACRKYAQSRGLNVEAELVEDEHGVSGSSPNRPQLKCLLEMARASEFDVLVVHDVYRLSRKLAILLALEHELSQCGVRIEYALQGDCQLPAIDLLKLVTVVPAMTKHCRKQMVIHGAQHKV
jgi:site-specific DNA recombinase